MMTLNGPAGTGSQFTSGWVGGSCCNARSMLPSFATTRSGVSPLIE